MHTRGKTTATTSTTPDTGSLAARPPRARTATLTANRTR
jgi:hypothetical protein